MTNEETLFKQCRSSQNVSDMETYFRSYPDGDHIDHIRGWYPDALYNYLTSLKVAERISECKKYRSRLDQFRKTDPENSSFWSSLIGDVQGVATNAHADYVEELKAKKGTMRAKEYGALFDDSILSDEDYNEIGLTKDDVEAIKQCRGTKTMNIPVLEEDVFKRGGYSLPAECTEIYFWGMPGSGKSCCLSALLSRATALGYCAGYESGISGNMYFQQLTNIFKEDGSVSTLIGGTNENSIAVASYKLIHPEYGKRRMCLIDLAGETFKSMHAKNVSRTIDETRQLCLDVTTSYLLDTQNRKLHFFIIPYCERDKVDDDGFTTSQYLQAGAEYLASRKIIKESTDGIYVIVTKADLMKCKSEDYAAEAEKYVKNRYKAFYNSMIDICEDNGIGTSSHRLDILPFSIGNMISMEMCKFDATGAEELLDILCKKSYKVSSKLGNFFGSILKF